MVIYNYSKLLSSTSYFFNNIIQSEVCITFYSVSKNWND